MKALLISTDSAHNSYRIEHNAYGGVAYYRLVAPEKAVNALGHEWYHPGNDLYKDGRDDFNKYFSNFDIVISKHIDNPSGAKNLQIACEKNNIPLVYDLDDDMFAMRSDMPSYEAYKKGEMKRVYLATNMSFADAFFVSTEPLKEVYQKAYKDLFNIDMPIHVLPNYNDVDLFTPYESKKNNDKVVLGYHGSTTHDSDLKHILPAIDKIMDLHRNVYMQVVGAIRKESVEIFGAMKNSDRVYIAPGTPAFDKFPEKLMAQQWDIGLAPLIDDQFNRGKSHIKYMEYSMKKIPTIASKVYPYEQNAKHAILCETNNDWLTALNRLVKDKKARDRIGAESYTDVVENWQYKDHAQKWVDAAQTVINNYAK